jgi:histidine triad (HIT) family protein
MGASKSIEVDLSGAPAMAETIFSKIIRHELPADIVYEDDEIIAFRDINPQAPVHVLVVPKVEIATVNDIQPGQAELIGKMVLAAQKIAAGEGISEDGFRLVINCNRHGCQEVFHLHLHLIGGRQLRGLSSS